jgi:hypothetical protein
MSSKYSRMGEEHGKNSIFSYSTLVFYKHCTVCRDLTFCLHSEFLIYFCVNSHLLCVYIHICSVYPFYEGKDNTVFLTRCDKNCNIRGFAKQFSFCCFTHQRRIDTILFCNPEFIHVRIKAGRCCRYFNIFTLE